MRFRANRVPLKIQPYWNYPPSLRVWCISALIITTTLATLTTLGTTRIWTLSTWLATLGRRWWSTSYTIITVGLSYISRFLIGRGRRKYRTPPLVLRLLRLPMLGCYYILLLILGWSRSHLRGGWYYYYRCYLPLRRVIRGRLLAHWRRWWSVNVGERISTDASSSCIDMV